MTQEHVSAGIPSTEDRRTSGLSPDVFWGGYFVSSPRLGESFGRKKHSGATSELYRRAATRATPVIGGRSQRMRGWSMFFLSDE